MNCTRCEIARAKVTFFVLFHVRGFTAYQIEDYMNETYGSAEVTYWVDREGFLRRSANHLAYFSAVGAEIGNLNPT